MDEREEGTRNEMNPQQEFTYVHKAIIDIAEISAQWVHYYCSLLYVIVLRKTRHVTQIIIFQNSHLKAEN